MRHLREFVFIVFVLSIFPFAAAAGAESQAVSDSALTAKVKSALTTARGAEMRNIQVETRNGVVQLSGFVGSEDARSAALMRARSVAGVAEVRNDLTVRNDARLAPQQPAPDTVIAARVRSSLSNARLDGESDVNVEVSAGVVQLSGFVTSVEEKVRAGDAASAVPGVRDVENNIALTKEHERRLPPE
ncbi:BON domain-containing protein [Steroidobacter cummioxidans]|uniref:BON domain-containing protein n=1 Tax=Steroidobacter cummioxidans TaxID=1803913 RepID=UPI00137B5E8A|nr:BON domain-containing protein [Steroidobacter cummioxidans]